MTEVKKTKVKNPEEHQLLFEFCDAVKNVPKCRYSQKIVPFVRSTPVYVFPYRICREYEDSGDAA